jgi:hypothetical protein
VAVVTGQPHGRANSQRLSTHYAAGLVLAHIIALTQSAAILIPLSGHTTSGAQDYLTLHNVILAVALAVLGTIVTAVGALVNLAPTLRWYVAGSEPSPGQRRAALSLITRQSAMLAATWAAAGTIFILLNRNGGMGFAVPCLLGIAVGASAAAGTGLLLTQRTLRPVIIAATAGSGEGVTAPGVLARLVVMWLLSGGLPLGVIAVIVIIQPRGWIIEKTAPVGIPVLVVSLAAVVLGLPIMILISRSISDPVCEVVDAMADVEQERLGTYVGVYERSEIGRLQRGFNRMVAYPRTVWVRVPVGALPPTRKYRLHDLKTIRVSFGAIVPRGTVADDPTTRSAWNIPQPGRECGPKVALLKRLLDLC